MTHFRSSARDPNSVGKIICQGPSKNDFRDSSHLDCYAAKGSFWTDSVSFSIDKRLWLVELQFDELYKEILYGYGSIDWYGVTLILEIIEKVTKGNDVEEMVRFSSGTIRVSATRKLQIRPFVYIKPNVTYEIRAKNIHSHFFHCVCVYFPYIHGKAHKLSDGTNITFDKNHGVIKSLEFKAVE